MSDRAQILVPDVPAGDPTHCLIAFEIARDGTVARWTEGAVRGLGWTTADVVGKLPPLEPPPALRGNWAALAPGAEVITDEPAVWSRASGSKVELAVSVSPIIDASGEVSGAIVTARDISLHRAFNDQLQAYARDIRESYGRELNRLAELETSYRATVEALANAVEAKDDTTGGHIRRVSELGCLFARAHLGPAADDPQLEFGFVLHDVGKLAVPDAVLNKPGSLDEDEWCLMQEHPEAGARILRGIPFLTRALDIVRSHHERWDGTGYPAGVAGENIPVGARLFAIVDTVDAMTSDRPYRAGLPLETALDEVRRQAGHQFDPACVERFLTLDRDQIQELLEPQDRS